MLVRMIVLAFVLGVAAEAALAGEDAARNRSDNAEVALRFFDRTCLKHYRDHGALMSKLAEGGDMTLPEMQGTLAQIFLGGGEGRVWLLKQGRSVFSLALRKDGLCTVFARRADESRVLEGIETLFGDQDFFGFRQVDSDHQGVMTRRFYELTPGGKNSTTAAEVMRMAVSTTRESKAQFQAALSLDRPVPRFGETSQ